MLPWNKGVNIICEKQGLIAVEKPCQVLSHPNDIKSNKSLLLAPYDMNREAYATKDGWVYLLNRLDAPTSGVLLLTRDVSVAKKVREAFNKHAIQKMYQALVKGRCVLPKMALWQDNLVTENSRYLRTQCSRYGKASKVRVQCVQYLQTQGQVLSYLQLYPLTGRTHQLRVQCAQHHYPILGDKTYGDFKLNRTLQAKRLYLHSKSIKIRYLDIDFEASTTGNLSDTFASDFLS